MINRDKIEFQFAVPKFARTTPKSLGARFRRDCENSPRAVIVNREKKLFAKFLPGTVGMGMSAHFWDGERQDNPQMKYDGSF